MWPRGNSTQKGLPTNKISDAHAGGNYYVGEKYKSEGATGTAQVATAFILCTGGVNIGGRI